MIPQLRRLEQRFPDTVVVIGVHSAKFPAEQEDENLRMAIARYGIEHPVVNDRDFLLWRAYGVRAWPTVLLIDPEGRVLGKIEGEFDGQALGDLIEEVAREWEAAGGLRREPVAWPAAPPPETTLSFPGKVAVDAARGRLWIADTNHHRILLAELPSPADPTPVAPVQCIIGAGEPGLADGDLATARFRSPQGIAVTGDPDCIVVADTENHALRQIDLRAGCVRRIAGTGEQARPYPRPGPATATALNSPWDVLWLDGTLFIAMAGCHQLHALDWATGTLSRFVGSGAESLQDGPAEFAALAQPSGLATDGQRLFFADSETSAIRYATLDEHPRVVTLVGTGLFDFGDQDGVGAAVRLQHPLGVAWLAGALYIADSYNHKIKRLDPDSRRVTTLAGSGEHGLLDGEGAIARFWEPGGIAAADGRLYVADTNHHAIRRVDPTDGTVTTIHVRL